MSIHCFYSQILCKYSIVFNSIRRFLRGIQWGDIRVFVGYLEYPGIRRYSMGIPWYSIKGKGYLLEKYSGLTRGKYPLVFHFVHRYSAKYSKVKVLPSIPKYSKVAQSIRKYFRKVFEHFEKIEKLHEYLLQNTNTLPFFE